MLSHKRKYARAVSIYVAGIVVIVIGLYLLMRAESFQDSFMFSNSFIVMMVGFAITVFGGVHGRHSIMKMKLGIEDMPKPPRPDEQKKQESAEDETRKAIEQLIKESEVRAEQIPAKIKPAKDEPPAPDEPEPPESEATEPEPPVAKATVVKVLMCPNCGEENKYTANFCDKCGKKLRVRKRSRKSAKK